MIKPQDPVLIVDDEADIRDLMEMTLARMGLRVQTAVGVADALKQLEQNRFSLVLTDMRMPDGSGLEVVRHINALHLDTPVAVITAFGSSSQADEALQAGAFDYLQKPITLAQLRTLVKSAVSVGSELAEPPHTPFRPSETATGRNPTAARPNPYPCTGADDIPRLLGNSPQILEARHLIRRLAGSSVPVYISGESGTGKEQAARSIHELSERAGKPFVAVNCGAIPESLMESEFFGYTKGSFTGADRDRNGFFQYADGGTLFLDEVAELPQTMQVKLLRAIQEKAVRRIGQAHETPLDVRIICATHKNLAALVESGAFRQDLYYRLNVVSLHMPPLREMREDLDTFIRCLLEKHRNAGLPYTLSPDAQQALRNYSYPGNFRELENILERAVALSSSRTIQTDDLQIRHSAPPPETEQTALPPDHAVCTELPPYDPRTMQIQDYLDQVERSLIGQALQQTHGNRTQAAKLLGISFRSMRYRMERLDIR